MMRSCEETGDGSHREVALIFRREELLYDIRNYLYIEGDLMADEDYHNRHVVQDGCEDSHVDRITRVLDIVHAECVEMLYPYTNREVDVACMDDTLREKDVYGVIMRLPEGFSQTTVRLLSKLIHELLVCGAVADWLSISHTDKSVVWEAKCEKLLESIRSKLMHRRSGIRIGQHPF